jgi:hypothetical protein
LQPDAKLLNNDVTQNDHAVCEILEVFNNQVHHQSGKKISTELADEIQTMIPEIQEQLAC